MKYLMFAVFALINLAVVLKIPEGLMKFKFLKLMGLAIPIVFALAVLSLFMMKVIGYVPGAQFKSVFFSFFLSILTVLLLNCMIIIGIYMIDKMTGFHQIHNPSQLDSFPVSFVTKHQQQIKTALKIIFYAGSLLMFYGLWIAKSKG